MLLHQIRITALTALAVVLLNLLPGGGVSASSSSLPTARPLATTPYTGFTPPPAWACGRTFTYLSTTSGGPNYGLATYLKSNGWGPFYNVYAYLPAGWLSSDQWAQEVALNNLLTRETLRAGDMVQIRYWSSYIDTLSTSTVNKLKDALNRGATVVVDTDSVASTGDLAVNGLFERMGVSIRRDQSRSYATSARFVPGYSSAYPYLNRAGASTPGQAVAVFPGNLLGGASGSSSSAIYLTDGGLVILAQEPVGAGTLTVLADTQAATDQTYTGVAASHPDHLGLQATHNSCTRHIGVPMQ